MGQRRIACSVAILLLALGSAVQQRCCWAQAIPPADSTARTDLYGDPLPTGAISRLGTTRFRHGSQWLKGLALTPDGKTLIAAAEEHSLHFWDTATGRQIKQLRTDPLSIRGFAMSPDGRQLAVAGFWYPEDNSGAKRQVRILDTASGEQIRTFSSADPDVDGHTMAFTPDGKMLVSLGTSGNARIEELASGVEILQYRFPRDNSPSLAISPDGSTIAISTGANTKKFFLWKWQTGEEPQELKVFGIQGGYGQLAFSPDGKQLAACLTHASYPLHVWEVETGRLRHHLALANPKEYLMGTVLFAPDGQNVIVPGWRSDNSSSVAIHLWNSSNGEYQGQMDVPAGGLLTMSANGQLLASSSGVGVRVWKWSTRQEVLPNEAAHRGSVGRVVMTPSGTVVTASDDGTIRLWDSASGRQLRELRHEYWVRDIALSPDGTRLASSSLDDTVRLWDVMSGREIYRLPGHGRNGGTRVTGFSADGASFGSFGDDCYLRIWDVRTGKALVEHKIRPTGVKIPEEGADMGDAFDFFHIDRAVFSPDATLLALSLGKHFVFRADTGQELRQIENPGSHCSALAISPGNRYLLASAWGKPQEIKMADGRTLHTTAKDHPVTLWDLENGQVVRQIMLPDGGVGTVAFSPDGQRFALSTLRPKNSITIFDAATGSELQSIDDVPSRVWSLCFGHDGKTLVAGLADSTAVIWDLTRLQSKH